MLYCVPTHQADQGRLPREHHQGPDLHEDAVHHGSDKLEAEDRELDIPTNNDHNQHEVQNIIVKVHKRKEPKHEVFCPIWRKASQKYYDHGSNPQIFHSYDGFDSPRQWTDHAVSNL